MNENKLELEKFTVSKIKNQTTIFGGSEGDHTITAGNQDHHHTDDDDRHED